MRAPGGNAAGFTGSATSSSRRSDWPIESGARAVKVTAGPSLRSGTLAARLRQVRVRRTRSTPETPGARTRRRARRPGPARTGSSSRAFLCRGAAGSPRPSSLRMTSNVLQSGASRSRTSTLSSTVVETVSPFAFLLAIVALMVVRPATPPFTMKSYVAWRRSKSAFAGASAIVDASDVNVALFGSHTSGSTVRRTGRCSPGATTTFGGSNERRSSVAVVGIAELAGPQLRRLVRRHRDGRVRARSDERDGRAARTRERGA